jgi:TetR/AcrR family transcriptional regulator, regulator of autoinduction and epiphytic fitness
MMTPMADVNPAIAPSPTRRERARATRRRIAEAAYTRFASQGYAATTIDSIAADASVAVQTVYFTFHTKAEVLIAALKLAGGAPGEDAEVMARGWIQAAMAAPDGARRLALIVEHGNEIYRRLAPMFPAVSAAASVDPDVAEAWRAMIHDRRTGMARFIALMAARGELRPGVDEKLGTDLVFALHRSELFLAFTADCGWSVESYKAWQFATLARQLLPDKVADAALVPGSAATRDLSFAAALEVLPFRPRGQPIPGPRKS